MNEAEIYATISDYDLMCEALDERRQELNLSCNELDDLAGIASGYVGKCFGGSRTAHLGWKSAFVVARALGLRIVVEIDPDATAATLLTARRRHAKQARPNNLAAKIGGRTLERVLRYLAGLSWNEAQAVLAEARATAAAEREAQAVRNGVKTNGRAAA